MKTLHFLQLRVRMFRDGSREDSATRSDLEDAGFGAFPNIFWSSFVWNDPENLYSGWNHLFWPCLTLFSGVSPALERDFNEISCTALSTAGICVYSGVLNNTVLNQNLGEIDKLYISPGNIEYNHETYSKVTCDIVYPSANRIKNLEGFLTTETKLTVKAREATSHISVWYELQSTDESLENFIPISPGEFANRVVEARGFVWCPSSLMFCRDRFALEIAEDGSFEVYGTRFRLLKSLSTMERAAIAFALASKGEDSGIRSSVLVQGNACLVCSVKAALRSEESEKSRNPLVKAKQYLWYIA
jgi:hypothetical protein